MSTEQVEQARKQLQKLKIHPRDNLMNKSYCYEQNDCLVSVWVIFVYRLVNEHNSLIIF
jgi:hypothetical protein